jgi:hypothetical protein
MGNAHRNQKNNDKALQGRNILTTIIMHLMMFDYALSGLGFVDILIS